MRHLSTSSGRGWPLVALGAMLWATDFVLRPALLKHVGFTSVRIVLYEHMALTLIFLPVLVTGYAEWRKISRREWLSLLYIAWGGSAVATVLISMAYQLGNPTNGALTATLLQKTQPLFAVLLAGILLKERRGPVFWVLFAGAMLATYLLSFGFMSPITALRSPHAASVGCALGASFLWGSCTVVGRQALSTLRPALVAAGRFTLALPLLIILNGAPLLLGGKQAATPVFSASALLLLLGIIFLTDVIAMVFYYTGLRSTPASQATIAELAYPLAAMLLGSFFLHQNLGVGQYIGIAALIVILPLVQWSHSVRDTADESAGDDPPRLRDAPGLQPTS